MPLQTVVLALAVLLSITDSAIAKISYLQYGKEVLAPTGFRELCKRSPFACRDDAGGSRSVNLTDGGWIALENYNQKLNSHIRYRTDWEAFGRSDYWVIAKRIGDCEDIALAKRQALVRAGWPGNALWLAIGRDRDGMAHVVLVVRSNRGDLVLDNRNGRVSPWYQVDLKWLARDPPATGCPLDPGENMVRMARS